MTVLRILLVCLTLPSLALAGSVRLKDLVEFDGVRGNDLVGYGLVVGLNGTGDGLRNAPFTEEIMTNILERLGVNVTGEQFRPADHVLPGHTGSLCADVGIQVAFPTGFEVGGDDRAAIAAALSMSKL